MTFQVSSGILDACVLSLVSHEDTYGYRITQEIKERLGISESTLYPVLRRLQKEELLDIYDREVGGRNRRYYHITVKGLEKYDYYQKEWRLFSKNISDILNQGELK